MQKQKNAFSSNKADCLYQLRLLALLFLFSSLAQLTTVQAQAQLSTPTEILSFMEASPINYKIELLEEPMPQRKLPILSEADYVLMIDEQAHLLNYQDSASKKVLRWHKKALNLYNQEKPNWKRMRRYCAKILQEQERADIYTLIGLSYYREQEPQKAATWFRRALSRNPLDYQARWSLADLAREAGRKEEASQLLLTAHIYNRNHPRLLKELEKNFLNEQREYKGNWRFEPQYVIYPDTAKQELIIAAKGIWMTYAMYKAVWNYEPGYVHIKERQEVTDYLFQEELEATLGLYLIYSQLPASEQLDRTPFQALDLAIQEAMLEEYVMYEILLVERPELAFLLTEDFLQRIRQYVLSIRAPKKAS